MNTMRYWITALSGLLVAGNANAGLFFVGEAEATGDTAALFLTGTPSYSLSYFEAGAHVTDDEIHGTTTEDFELAKFEGNVAGYVLVPPGLSLEQIRLSLAGTSQVIVPQPSPASDPEMLTRIIRETRKEALAAHLGGTLYRLPAMVGPVSGTLECHWVAKRNQTDGVLRLPLPMPLPSLSSGPVGRVVLRAELHSKIPIRAVFSPTHECRVTRQTARAAQVQMSQDLVGQDTPMELLAVLDEDPMGLRMFAHRPESMDDGYFVLVGCATDRQPDPAPAEWVFVVDTSGSMRGDKMEQARAALEYCLGQLGPRDRFNVVSFSDAVHPLFPSPTPVSADSRKRAQQFVDALEPAGHTNIGDALAFAVTGAASEKESDLPRQVLFLTDGTPTVGERKPEIILSRVAEVQKPGTRIFSMGIGYDVNAVLLDRLAIASRGDSAYVDADQDLDEIVADLFNRIAHPVMRGVTLDFADLDVREQTPKQLPDLYRDNLFFVAGRYRQGRTAKVAVVEAEGGRSFTRQVVLPAETMDNSFVAALWAARRLGDQLESMRLHGESKERLTEVVSLSRRYGILTEYTAEINSEAGAVLSDADLAGLVQKRSEQARDNQSGQWAVNQSKNEKGLKERVAASAEGNVYEDAQGNVVQADKIRQVGNTAYYLRNGVWEQADDGRARQTRVVEKFSKEYFELLRSNKDLSRAVSLGEEVIVNVGDEKLQIK